LFDAAGDALRARGNAQRTTAAATTCGASVSVAGESHHHRDTENAEKIELCLCPLCPLCLCGDPDPQTSLRRDLELLDLPVRHPKCRRGQCLAGEADSIAAQRHSAA